MAERYRESAIWHERARNVLAGGVSSEFRKSSPGRNLVYSYGSGSRVVDVDGNDYLDFTLSQGPLILGHSPREVLDAVAEASAQGQIFAGQFAGEIQLAETLQRLIPCAQRMRFSLSGSEADHTALRVARALTRRPLVLRFEGHYHGWFDSVASALSVPSPDALGSRESPNVHPWSAGLAPGALDGQVVLPWNDLGLVERVLEQRHSEIAAVITEPVMCNSGCIPPEPGFLEGLRALCDRYQIVLIFDEVITGFRMGLGGAQERTGVVPDLAVFGKALANGYPISVIAGREWAMRPIAEGTVVHAGTMNAGNPSIAAASATLRILERDNVPQKLQRLGERLRDGLRKVGDASGLPVRVQGPGPMLQMGFSKKERCVDWRDTLAYDRPRYKSFLDRMQDRGIRLIGRGLWYVSAAHTEADIDHAVAVAGDVLGEMAAAD